MIQPLEFVVAAVVEPPHWFSILAAVKFTPAIGAPELSETVLSQTPIDSPEKVHWVLVMFDVVVRLEDWEELDVVVRMVLADAEDPDELLMTGGTPGLVYEK